MKSTGVSLFHLMVVSWKFFDAKSTWENMDLAAKKNALKEKGNTFLCCFHDFITAMGIQDEVTNSAIPDCLKALFFEKRFGDFENLLNGLDDERKTNVMLEISNALFCNASHWLGNRNYRGRKIPYTPHSNDAQNFPDGKKAVDCILRCIDCINNKNDSNNVLFQEIVEYEANKIAASSSNTNSLIKTDSVSNQIELTNLYSIVIHKADRTDHPAYDYFYSQYIKLTTAPDSSKNKQESEAKNETQPTREEEKTKPHYSVLFKVLCGLTAVAGIAALVLLLVEPTNKILIIGLAAFSIFSSVGAATERFISNNRSIAPLYKP